MDPPNFHRLFRQFLGFDSLRKDLPPENRESCDEDVRCERPNFNHFQVFTNPQEIDRFFQQQMEEMFREFRGMGDILDSNGFPGDWGHSERSREIRQHEELTDRDMMLKHDDYSSRQREDQDFDDKKLTADDLSQLFKGNGEAENSLESRNNHFGELFGESPATRKFDFVPPEMGEGGIRTFSFSRSTRTVRRPDGSVEVEERTSNPDGSETVTIRRSLDSSANEFSGVFQDPGDLLAGKFGFGFGPPNFHIPKVEQGQKFDPENGPVADKKYASIFSKFFGSD